MKESPLMPTLVLTLTVLYLVFFFLIHRLVTRR